MVRRAMFTPLWPQVFAVLPSELHRLLVNGIVFKSSGDAFPPRLARRRCALQQLLDLGHLSFERGEPRFYGLGRHPYPSTIDRTVSQRSGTDTERRLRLGVGPGRISRSIIRLRRNLN